MNTEILGRFGHHPDPAIDYAIEVDVIEGLVEDCKAGLEKREAVEERIARAMQFRVGGTVLGISAKQALRDAEAKLKTSCCQRMAEALKKKSVEAMNQGFAVVGCCDSGCFMFSDGKFCPWCGTSFGPPNKNPKGSEKE